MLSAMWTEADLAYNRRGEVSPNQRRRLGTRWGAMLGGFVVATATLGVLTYVGVFDASPGLQVGGILWWIPVLALLPAVRATWRLLAMRGRRVVVLGGRLDFGRGPNWDGDLGHWIGGHLIKPLAGIDDLFTKEVAAYMLPRTKLIIAIERSRP
jgi:hypothetical protein